MKQRKERQKGKKRINYIKNHTFMPRVQRICGINVKKNNKMRIKPDFFEWRGKFNASHVYQLLSSGQNGEVFGDVKFQEDLVFRIKEAVKEKYKIISEYLGVEVLNRADFIEKIQSFL